MPVAVGEESVGGVSFSEVENKGFWLAHEIERLGIGAIGPHLNTAAAERRCVAQQTGREHELRANLG